MSVSVPPTYVFYVRNWTFKKDPHHLLMVPVPEKLQTSLLPKRLLMTSEGTQQPCLLIASAVWLSLGLLVS